MAPAKIGLQGRIWSASLLAHFALLHTARALAAVNARICLSAVPAGCAEPHKKQRPFPNRKGALLPIAAAIRAHIALDVGDRQFPAVRAGCPEYPRCAAGRAWSAFLPLSKAFEAAKITVGLLKRLSRQGVRDAAGVPFS